MSLTMLRIDVSRPPGVSICRTTSWAWSCAARSSERKTYSAAAGPIAPSMRSTNTAAGWAPASAATPSSTSRQSRQRLRMANGWREG
jgi:hypothetical protein